MTRAARVVWLFDGFNLYHSIRHSRTAESPCLNWINPVQLARDHLHVIGGSCELEAVHFFTAIPDHMEAAEPGVVSRHRAHLRALTALRPPCQLHLGHFQPRRGLEGKAWQEKGTDMSIAATAIRACQDHERLALVIASGDSDFVPLAKLVAERWPEVDLRFAFPAHRVSRRLRQLCPGSFGLGSDSFAKAQLPAKVRLPSGKFIDCPEEWK